MRPYVVVRWMWVNSSLLNIMRESAARGGLEGNSRLASDFSWKMNLVTCISLTDTTTSEVRAFIYLGTKSCVRLLCAYCNVSVNHAKMGRGRILGSKNSERPRFVVPARFLVFTFEDVVSTR